MKVTALLFSALILTMPIFAAPKTPQKTARKGIDWPIALGSLGASCIAFAGYGKYAAHAEEARSNAQEADRLVGFMLAALLRSNDRRETDVIKRWIPVLKTTYATPVANPTSLNNRECLANYLDVKIEDTSLSSEDRLSWRILPENLKKELWDIVVSNEVKIAKLQTWQRVCSWIMATGIVTMIAAAIYTVYDRYSQQKKKKQKHSNFFTKNSY